MMIENFSILLVDDEPFNIEYLRQELEDYGIRFIIAENGQQAIEQYQLHKPDLIFLDMMMPEVDGFAVMEKLKPHIISRETEVIIISALNDSQSIEKGLELGAADYLSKPFEPLILHARIKSFIEKWELRQIEKLYFAGLEKEMEIGRKIQADFLPSEIPQINGWELAVKFLPAMNVAGDFYDVFKLSERVLAVISGDVCDKGIGAALYMALYRSFIHAYSMVEFSEVNKPGNNLRVIAENVIGNTIRKTNSYICATHPEALFSSLFFGLLDLTTGDLFYTNAGHELPILFKAPDRLIRLAANSPVLGFDGSAQYEIASANIANRDLLLIVSDGVYDAENGSGERFRENPYLEHFSPPISSCEGAVNDLLDAINEFTMANIQFDDITILGIYRN